MPLSTLTTLNFSSNTYGQMFSKVNQLVGSINIIVGNNYANTAWSTTNLLAVSNGVATNLKLNSSSGSIVTLANQVTNKAYVDDTATIMAIALG